MKRLNPDSVMKVIGEQIKKARERRGLSQEELGQLLGDKNQPTISSYELGKRRFRVVDLLRLSEALETPIISLFGFDVAADADMELALLTWFRSLPENRKPRVFKVLKMVEPMIIGDMPDEETVRLNEDRARYKTGAGDEQ